MSFKDWPKEALCARGCGRLATARVPLKGGGFSLDRGVYGTWIQVCEDYYKGRRGCVSRPRYWLHRLVQWLLALSLVGCGGAPFSAEALRAQDDAATDGAPAADSGPGGAEASSDGGSASDAAPEAGEAQACTLVTHSDGLGQTWQDCVALGTFDVTEGAAACAAHDGGACSGGWACDGQALFCVMGTGGSCAGPCWDYSGNRAGAVTSVCACPFVTTSHWN